jgi:hypothetical protein
VQAAAGTRLDEMSVPDETQASDRRVAELLLSAEAGV